jgi:hypothetical protein
MTYSPEDQALIDRVNADHEAQSGYDRLWGWFGLSRASWLTMPRVVMHKMPDDWQKRMAVLLEEFNDGFPHWPDIETHVVGKRHGKFARMPEWLCNYRRPMTEVETMRRAS